MPRHKGQESGSAAFWPWAVMAGLSLTQPVICFWLYFAPPHGLVSSGLHIPDSALFLHSMRMFRTGFESLYATCLSTQGSDGIAFFPLPHLWLYGALGLIAQALDAPDFLVYGMANGIGAFLYLAIVYVFFREIAPRYAEKAFLLFSLGGGLGGVLYILTGVLGLHNTTGFEDYFRRYALYELFEGAHLQPIACLPRLYYTLSLALCLGALTCLMRGVRTSNRAWVPWVVAMLPFGAFIDLRYGVFSFLLAVLYLWAQSDKPVPHRIICASVFGAPILLGGMPALALMHSNPLATQNHFDAANHAMWLSPFLSVIIFYLAIVPCEIRARLRNQTPEARLAVLTALGYLVAFFFLFCVYQIYYGNVLVARDAAVAPAISDWALLGAIAGAGYAWFRSTKNDGGHDRDWVLMWLLLFLALSISAFGGGWFLRFGPQRMQILLWPALCVVAAGNLSRLSATRPRTARLLTGATVFCGVCSTAVAALCFQAPLGYRPAQSPYAASHAEVMTDADARVMAQAGEGIVLALPPASDIIALNRGNRVVYGIGSFNCSDQRYITLRSEVETFFAPQTPNDVRRALVERYCVDYVYCPDTWPVAQETLDALRNVVWLEEIATEGRASLFHVLKDSPGALASASG